MYKHLETKAKFKDLKKARMPRQSADKTDICFKME